MKDKPDKTHGKATSVYGEKAKQVAGTQCELEGQLLMKYAHKMMELQERWDDMNHDELDQVLTYNRKLWTFFYDAALEEKEGDIKRPKDLRNNIIALSEYIFNRTIKTLAAPEKDKLTILIDINKEIAAGLLANPASTDAQLPDEKKEEEPRDEEQQKRSSTNISA